MFFIQLIFVFSVSVFATEELLVLPNQQSQVRRLDDMIYDVPALDYSGSYKIQMAKKFFVRNWQDGVLPLSFAKGTSNFKKRIFFDACDELSKVANIRCVEGAYKSRVIKVTARPEGCYAFLGMSMLASRRIINLGSGCWEKYVIIHELGHILGFIHEHQRLDRNMYIDIKYENIYGKYFSFFASAMQFRTEQFTLNTPYDFMSMMHYENRAFSKNGKPTIVPKKEYMQYENLIGTAELPSKLDALALSSIYGDPL